MLAGLDRTQVLPSMALDLVVDALVLRIPRLVVPAPMLAKNSLTPRPAGVNMTTFILPQHLDSSPLPSPLFRHNLKSSDNG